MSESLLSADEIRDLLQQPGKHGAVRHLWEGEARPFNLFSAASKIEEKLVLAESMHRQMTGPLGQAISTLCHLQVTVDYIGQQMRPVRDILAETAVDQVFPVRVEESGLALEGLVLCERKFFFYLYNQVLGGMRDFLRDGEITRFERAFFDRLMAPCVQALTDVWKSCGVTEFAVRDLYTTQEQLGTLNWVFDAVQVEFSCTRQQKKGDDTEHIPLGSLKVVLPKDLLAMLGGSPVRADVVQAAGEVARLADPIWIEVVQWAVADVSVPVTVGLGAVRAVMHNVLHMTPGLVLPFVAPPEDHPVFVRGREMFRASLGQVEDRRAVQIEELVH